MRRSEQAKLSEERAGIMAEDGAIKLSQFQEFDPVRPVSKLLHDSEKSRVVLFCLEPGQEIASHTSTSEVVFYGVDGGGTILLGESEVELEPRAIVVCPPVVPHGIKTGERMVVLAIITPRPE